VAEILGNSDKDEEKVLPIIKKCNYIHHTLLKRVDSELYFHLEKTNVAPQIYGLRWVRLLVGREFHLEDVITLWDALFADNLELIEYVCVSMLVYIREQLLTRDYSGMIQRLMRYPPVEDVFLFATKALQLKYPQLTPKPEPVVVQPTIPNHSTLAQTNITGIPVILSTSTTAHAKPIFRKIDHKEHRKGVEQVENAIGKASDYYALCQNLQIQQQEAAQRLDTLISTLHSACNAGENKVDANAVLLSLAELKQIRDILKGTHPSAAIANEEVAETSEIIHFDKKHVTSDPLGVNK